MNLCTICFAPLTSTHQPSFHALYSEVRRKYNITINGI
jgi:hypothetical protein